MPINGQSLPDALQDQLQLSNNELAIILRLVAWGQLAREQVTAIATHGHRSITMGSVNGLIGGLRRKLSKHGIELVTLHNFGWALLPKGQSKIIGLIKPRSATPTERTARQAAEAAGAKIFRRSKIGQTAA